LTTRFTTVAIGRAIGASFAANFKELLPFGFAVTALTGAALIFAGELTLAFVLLDGFDFATSFFTDFALIPAFFGFAIVFVFAFVLDLTFDFTAMTHILSRLLETPSASCLTFRLTLLGATL